eukprot:GEMP01001245.1.p1 GENE.GEMP01001245.1~~GEMP01001245.1.p1  ORF type:complete len:1596 (+),score=441.91 GEMP01001245.1:137-4924(+)
MLSRRRAKYCHICRDDGDVELICSMCRVYFHAFCFHETYGPELLHSNPFVCQPCYEERGDITCVVCKKGFPEANSRLKCVCCPIAVHKWCIRNADDERWTCEKCIHAHKQHAKRPSRVIGRVIKKTTGSETASLLHQPFCEVCQKGQRLLLCDRCPKSFHASCIEHIVNLREVGDSELWKCPVCDGLDVYGDHGHGNFSVDELKRRMAYRNARTKARIRRTLERRNEFLARPERLSLLRPFICDEVRRKLEASHWNQKTTIPMFGDVVCFIAVDGTRVQGTVVGEEENILSIAWRDGCARVPVEHVRFPPRSQSQSNPVCVNYLSTTKDGTDFLAEGIALKDYQVQAVDWLLNCFSNLGGAILADDMGLGKTLEAISVCGYLHLRGIPGPHLVVVPSTCLGNWQRECRRFCPQLKAAKVAGSRQEREWALGNHEVLYGARDVYITTYETLTCTEHFFATHVWQTLILDEAHRVKDQDGRVRKALSHIDCNFRLLLTGTPLQNNIKELFTLLNYVWPDVLRDSGVFERAIQINPAIFSDGEHLNTDSALVPKIRQLLQQLMLRRTKGEVLRLPPKLIRDVWLPMSPFTVQFARALHRVREESQDSGNGRMRRMLALVMKMRILGCHPKSLVDRQNVLGDLANLPCMKDIVQKAHDMTPQEHLRASTKLIFLDKLLMQLHHENMREDANWRKSYKGWKKPPDAPASVDVHFDKEMIDVTTGNKKAHKVLLFSQFQLCLDQLQRYCEWRKWKFLRLDGSTHKVVRELDTKDFNNEDSDHIIYLISTRAGGLGINLHSANFVVLYDQDWNPHIDTQAMDRAHRIGQERPVTVYRLAHEWTVEERLIFRQQQKRKLDQLLVQKQASPRTTVMAASSLDPASMDDDGHHSVDEKLTSGEIMSLLKYGADVIKTYEGEDTTDWSLDQYLKRQHSALPEEKDLLTVDSSASGGRGQNAQQHYSTLDMMQRLDGPADAPAFYQPEAKQVDVAEQQGDQFGRRSTRVRKAVIQWEPEDFRKKKVVRKAMKHDDICFCCKEEAKSENTPLLPCERCPKAYHPECQGLKDTPNKFTCSWHDCLGCRRNGSEVGGILVSCTGCPKSYCPDCFPQTFRRVYPPESFFAQLQKQGWVAAIPGKMINFQCNDCRLAEEAQRKAKTDLEAVRQKEKEEMMVEKMRLRDQKDTDKIARKKQLDEERQKERAINDATKKKSTDDDHQRVIRFKALQKRERDTTSRFKEVINQLYPPIFRRMWGVFQLKEDDIAAASRDEIRRTLYHEGMDINGAIDVLRKRVAAVSRSKAKLRKTLGLSMCTNCQLVGHSKDTCIYPAERKRKENSAMSVCSECQKASHGRIQCKQIPDKELEAYEERYTKIEDMLTKLAESEVADSETFFETSIWQSVERVTDLVKGVVFRTMQEVGLGGAIVEEFILNMDLPSEDDVNFETRMAEIAGNRLTKELPKRKVTANAAPAKAASYERSQRIARAVNSKHSPEAAGEAGESGQMEEPAGKRKAENGQMEEPAVKRKAENGHLEESTAKRGRVYTEEDAAVAMERLKYQVKEAGVELPAGWQCDVAASQSFLKFVSPDGHRFASVKKAAEFITNGAR